MPVLLALLLPFRHGLVPALQSAPMVAPQPLLAALPLPLLLLLPWAATIDLG
jgi:hypothetical protein